MFAHVVNELPWGKSVTELRAQLTLPTASFCTLYYFPTTHFYFPKTSISNHKNYQVYIKCLKNFPDEISYYILVHTSSKVEEQGLVHSCAQRFSPLKARGFLQIRQGYPVYNTLHLACSLLLELISRVPVRMTYLPTPAENHREPKLCLLFLRLLSLSTEQTVHNCLRSLYQWKWCTVGDKSGLGMNKKILLVLCSSPRTSVVPNM